MQPLHPKLPADTQIFTDSLEGQVRRSAWQQQGSPPPCVPLHPFRKDSATGNSQFRTLKSNYLTLKINYILKIKKCINNALT